MTFTSWIRRERAILIRCSKTRLDYLGLLLLLATLGSLSNHGSDGGKRYFKSEFALFQISSLFHLVQFRKCWGIFLEWSSKSRYLSSEKEKLKFCLVSTSSKKREIRKFRVVVVQWRQRNVQKNVMHVQSCCFANLNQSFFCRSRCRRRRRCLKSVREIRRENHLYQLFMTHHKMM